MNPIRDLPGLRCELLAELEIAARQLAAIAEAIPAERYDWRPDTDARSVSEVFVHVAAGTFLLLDHVGTPVPSELYGSFPPDRLERLSAIVRKNDDMEKTVRDKPAVLALLTRSLESARSALVAAHNDELGRHLDENTTVWRVYIRLVAHTHEHMGQMIAYLRTNGLRVPWPDWRPDRQT